MREAAKGKSVCLSVCLSAEVSRCRTRGESEDSVANNRKTLVPVSSKNVCLSVFEHVRFYSQQTKVKKESKNQGQTSKKITLLRSLSR